MPVDEEINLDNPDGITQEDIEIMERQALELEELAQGAENNAEKIEKAKKSIEGLSFAQLNLMSESMQGGGGDIDTQVIMQKLVEVMEELEKAKGERKENKSKLTEAELERKAQVKRLKEVEGNIKKGAGEVQGLLNSPISFGKSKIMGLIGKAGIYGMVAQFVIQMGEQIYEQSWQRFKDAFKAGGIFDIRKLVNDEVRQYNSMNYLNRIKSGKIFFTADAGQYLRQGASRDAGNTRDLRDGHMRFINRERGY